MIRPYRGTPMFGQEEKPIVYCSTIHKCPLKEHKENTSCTFYLNGVCIGESVARNGAYSIKQVADILKISRVRVGQLERLIIKKLNRYLGTHENKQLRQELKALLQS